MNWQPIETAPEDEYVLIARDGYPLTVAKNQGRGDWVLAACGSYASDGTPDGEPTHWMPLPAKPEAKR